MSFSFSPEIIAFEADDLFSQPLALIACFLTCHGLFYNTVYSRLKTNHPVSFNTLVYVYIVLITAPEMCPTSTSFAVFKVTSILTEFFRDVLRAIILKSLLGSLCFSTFLFISISFYYLTQTSYFSLIFTELHSASITMGTQQNNNYGSVTVVQHRPSWQTAVDLYRPFEDSCSQIMITITCQLFSSPPVFNTVHMSFSCASVQTLSECRARTIPFSWIYKLYKTKS